MARFEVSSNDPSQPLLISFRDRSDGQPVSWRWDFGDKKGTSDQQNPKYTYRKPGTYTAKLTVANRLGSTATKTETIRVPLNVRFEVRPAQGTAPLLVKCTDRSIGEPTSWRWDFGDRDTSSQQSPQHTYRKPGIYTVRLTITNRAGPPVSATKTVHVTRAKESRS